MQTNRQLADIFKECSRLVSIQGAKTEAYRVNAYNRAARILDSLQEDIKAVFERDGLAGIKKLGIGEKNAKKIEQYLKKGKIKEYEELQEETAIRQVITHFFASKGVGLQELKNNAKKRKIIYSRFTKPAKQLIELAGSVAKATAAIDTVAAWANSRKLDYAIETVFKKWLELDRLKPKEVVKKPFYLGDPMVWSEIKKKWYVIDKRGQWLEYAGKEADMEWRVVE